MTHENNLSYKSAGVDIDAADAAKRAMSASLQSNDSRVLNRIGAFASLFEARFPGISDPVLVMKMEEPGSKQKLAFEHGRVQSICEDLVHHLINDIAVMGAEPLMVQDAIICGKLEQTVVNQMVAAMAEACRRHGCSLVGGETSEQPGVLAPGMYVLAASVVGVVDRAKIVDGSKIAEGDAVIAIASNGVHTNGYSLIRALIAKHPDILSDYVGDRTFLDAIMLPHLCYLAITRELAAQGAARGLAHITGGGIRDNLGRIIPPGMCARVNLEKVRILPVFAHIKQRGMVPDQDMLRTFNLGVGMIAVCEAARSGAVCDLARTCGFSAYEIGTVERRAENEPVQLRGVLKWQ